MTWVEVMSCSVGLCDGFLLSQDISLIKLGLHLVGIVT